MTAATLSFTALPTRPLAPAGAPMRLTARGQKLARAATFFSILVLVFAFFGAKAQGASAPSPVSNYQQITVVPGETLWEIAQTVGNQTGFHGDLRDLVDQIISLNGLASSAISAGAHLTVPMAK
ncbi:MAG TPA: LysM peptidoglycan-binding domain-containing protein [Candidatus Nanopelagicaceae bacterium]|nr:LysM peptidoglycan-binding domain-containing protein [Candidatus Nanopelagicaceae bacterium]